MRQLLPRVVYQSLQARSVIACFVLENSHRVSADDFKEPWDPLRVLVNNPAHHPQRLVLPALAEQLGDFRAFWFSCQAGRFGLRRQPVPLRSPHLGIVIRELCWREKLSRFGVQARLLVRGQADQRPGDQKRQTAGEHESQRIHFALIRHLTGWCNPTRAIQCSSALPGLKTEDWRPETGDYPLNTLSAASRPDVPVRKPPGCVPAPHR